MGRTNLHLVPPPQAYLTEEEASLFGQMLEGYANHQRARSVGEQTVREHQKALRDLAAHCRRPPWRWEPTDYTDWAASYRHLAEASQRKMQTPVKTFYTWLIGESSYPEILRARYGTVLRPPATSRNTISHRNEDESSRPTPTITVSQLKAFFSSNVTRAEEAARFGGKDFWPILRDDVMFIVSYNFGLRVSEMLALTVNDFAPDARHPYLGPYASVQVLGKGGKKRTIPALNPDVASKLRHYLEVVRPVFLAKAPPGTDLLFLSERGEGLSRAAYMQRLQLALERAGLGGLHLTSHSFRRAFATQLYESGVALAVIQRYLGHAFMSTTQRYLRLGDEYVDMQTQEILARIEEAAGRTSREAGDER